ncbi:MAG: hypothetical protein ACRDFX_13335, partial [Chloroflexota bacterium]
NRKLASDEAEHRRHMAATFSATLRRYRERHPEIVADAIASRKRTEQAWINAEMGSATEDGPESQASP